MTQQYAPKKKPDALLVKILEWQTLVHPRPSKFMATSDGDDIELTVWQDDKNQEDIRAYLSGIDPRSLAGSTMLATVQTPGKDFGGTMQYKLTGLKATGAGDQPPAPAPAQADAPAAPAPAAKAKPIDGARWGNCMNNATLINVHVPPEEREAVWKQLLHDAAWLYTRTAEDIAAFLEEEPEAEAEEVEESLGVVSVDEVQHGN